MHNCASSRTYHNTADAACYYKFNAYNIYQQFLHDTQLHSSVAVDVSAARITDRGAARRQISTPNFSLVGNCRISPPPRPQVQHLLLPNFPAQSPVLRPLWRRSRLIFSIVSRHFMTRTATRLQKVGQQMSANEVVWIQGPKLQLGIIHHPSKQTNTSVPA